MSGTLGWLGIGGDRKNFMENGLILFIYLSIYLSTYYTHEVGKSKYEERVYGMESCRGQSK